MHRYDLATQVLFAKGFGSDSRTVVQYRRGIEPIPEGLLADEADLFLLSLADPRPGLLRACRFLNVQYEDLGYTEDTTVPFDDRFPLPTGPFWFRHDDGRRNLGRPPDRCRDENNSDATLVATALEAVFAYAHHPNIVVEGEHVIDAPGSVRRYHRVHCVCLGCGAVGRS